MNNQFLNSLLRSGYASVATGKGIDNHLPGNLPSTGYVPIVSQDCLRNSVISQNLVNQGIDETSDNTEQLGLFCEAPKPKEERLTLRDYQKDSVNGVLRHWKQGNNRVLAQQPTGAGKSLIIVFLVWQILNRGERVLIIAHKVELIKQLVNHFERWLGFTPGVIADKSQFKRQPDKLIQVASIQALNYLKDWELPPASLVVVDEAHHSHARSYARIFGHYQDAYFLGVTATPMRIDGRGLRYLHDGIKGFDALVPGVPVRELIELGYLSDFKLFTSETILDPKAVGIHTRAGDYVQSELEDYTESILLKGEIVDTWLKHAKGKRTVLYPVSVELSKQYCDEFNSRGIPASHIDASTPAREREQILEDFRSGKVLVLCQHSIVIEGVDLPSIECVQFARPTKSLTIWFQAIGRALRPAPGKPHAIIIDHSTTHLELPWLDEPIEWSLDPASISEGKGTLKCPECDHVYRRSPEDVKRSWSQCPVCQTKFSFEVLPASSGEPHPKVVEILPADFVEVERQLNQQVMDAVETLFDIYKERGYQKGWIGHQVLKIPEIGYFELLEVAKRLEYKPGWAHYKHIEIKKSKEVQNNG